MNSWIQNKTLEQEDQNTFRAGGEVGFAPATHSQAHPTVSWADLIQLASATAIEMAGGPVIPMKSACEFAKHKLFSCFSVWDVSSAKFKEHENIEETRIIMTFLYSSFFS